MAKRAAEHGAGGKWDALTDVLELLYPLHKEIDRYLFDISLRRLFDEMLEEYVEHKNSDGQSKLDLDKYSHQLDELLEEVMACLEQSLDSKQFDVGHLQAFAKMAAYMGNVEVAQNASLVADILSGKKVRPAKHCPTPISFPEPKEIIQLLRHLNDSGPAAELLQKVAPIFGTLPSQSLRDDTELELIPDDPEPITNGSLRRWLGEWTEWIGIEEFEMIKLPGKSKIARAFPGTKPVVALMHTLRGTPAARGRFFIGRSLFRAFQGLGAFKVGEVAGPVRWLMAVVVVVTGEVDDLPSPTARSIVDLLGPVLDKKLRSELAELCNDVLDLEKQDLISWVEASLFSADRFGLLVSGDPRLAIRWILEESSGSIGLERLKQDGASVYTKVPRCQALLEFVLSDEYVQLTRLLGKRMPSIAAPVKD